jgi:hypothetical protein
MDIGTPVIALDHPSAYDTQRVGRKAATLAVARGMGLPVGPGVVLTSDWSPDQGGVLHQVWRTISHDGSRPLVVRRSPMACAARQPREPWIVGPVRAVTGAQEFTAAVEAVHDPCTAVLVQPVADAAWRGIVFGDGPDTGRRTRPVVACIAVSTPDDVWVAEIDHHGRVRDVISGGDALAPPVELTATLARLSRRVDRTFDGGHDVDWVARPDGSLRLVDVRPGLVADQWVMPPAEASSAATPLAEELSRAERRALLLALA